jgi:hypothetical protein
VQVGRNEVFHFISSNWGEGRKPLQYVWNAFPFRRFFLGLLVLLLFHGIIDFYLFFLVFKLFFFFVFFPVASISSLLPFVVKRRKERKLLFGVDTVFLSSKTLPTTSSFPTDDDRPHTGNQPEVVDATESSVTLRKKKRENSNYLIKSGQPRQPPPPPPHYDKELSVSAI